MTSRANMENSHRSVRSSLYHIAFMNKSHILLYSPSDQPQYTHSLHELHTSNCFFFYPNRFCVEAPAFNYEHSGAINELYPPEQVPLSAHVPFCERALSIMYFTLVCRETLNSRNLSGFSEYHVCYKHTDNKVN